MPNETELDQLTRQHYEAVNEAITKLQEQDAEIGRLRDLNDEVLAALRVYLTLVPGIDVVPGSVYARAHAVVVKAESTK